MLSPGFGTIIGELPYQCSMAFSRPGCPHAVLYSSRISSVSQGDEENFSNIEKVLAKPVFRHPYRSVIGRQNVEILACLALGRVVDQRFLKTDRMDAIGDDQTRNPFWLADRGRISDRSAPVMTGQYELLIRQENDRRP